MDSSTSIASLYRKFIETHPNLAPAPSDPRNDTTKVKLWLFEKIFNYEFNISFGFPRSDICEMCETLDVQVKLAEMKNSPEA